MVSGHGGGTTSYAWDFENRLTSVTLPGSGGTVSFAYDPFGRRIKKVTPSTTSIFAYDGDNLIEETNSSGTVVARYEQSLNIDEPLAMLRSGVTSYHEADGLGSVTSLSNSSGAIANTYTYDSYGNLTASTGTLVNSFRYTAREFDTETNLYYYRNRYYDPNVGRFISEDPIGFASSINFYPYVHNGPTMYTDPWGWIDLDITQKWSTREPSFWDWHSGNTSWLRKVSAECMCVPGGWQIRIKVSYLLDVWYARGNDNAKAHEQRHVDLAIDFLKRHIPQHDSFEKGTYRLKETCEYYLRRDVTGEGFSGSPFLDQLNADDRALKELEKRLEPWWDIYQRW